MAATKRGALTREAIVDAAIELGDAGGLEAISMRAIGARLGVQAMSLYHHVANKAELLDAIHERLILSLTLEDAGEEWTEVLASIARSYRCLALAHPQIFVLLTTRPLATQAEVVHVLPVWELLRRAGFGPSQQLLIVEVFFTSLNGILLAEVAPVPGHAAVPEPDFTAAYLAVSAAENSSDALAGLTELITDHSDEMRIASWFDQAVGLLLAGLRTLVPDTGK